VWELPDGVTFEQAEQLHRQMTEWGLWEPDPGGFVAISGDEWRWLAHPPPEACAPIPCPSFAEYDPAADMNARGYQGSPLWRREVARRFGDEVARELAIKGEVRVELCAPAVCQQEHVHNPTLRWALLTVDDCAGDVERYALSTDPPPQVDPQRDLVDPRQIRPQYPASREWVDRVSVYTPPARERTAQDRAEQWRANFDWTGGRAPLFVQVPSGVQEQRLADAIRLCQQAGLIPDTPNGVVYIPEGTEMP
jgi:hypothetical protein